MMQKLAVNGGEKIPMPEKGYTEYIYDFEHALEHVEDYCPQFKAVVHFNSLDGIISSSDWFAEDIVDHADFSRGHAITVFDKNEHMFPTLQEHLDQHVFEKNDQLVSNSKW